MPRQLHETAGRSDAATARRLRDLPRALGDSARLCACRAGLSKDDCAHQSHTCATNCAQRSARNERLDCVLASIGPPAWWSAKLESTAPAPTWIELGATSNDDDDSDELHRLSHASSTSGRRAQRTLPDEWTRQTVATRCPTGSRLPVCLTQSMLVDLAR